MAERGADAYALTTPSVKRRDTVTSQLQREILGFSAAMGAATGYADGKAGGDNDITASSRREASAANEEKEEAKEEKGEEEEEEEEEEGEMRRTLSPTAAARMLRGALAAAGATSRADTASPASMRRVLLEELSAEGRSGDASPALGDSVSSMELRDSPARRRRSAERAARTSPAKRSRSSRSPQAPLAHQLRMVDGERRASATVDSFTAGLFSSSVLDQQAAADEDEEKEVEEEKEKVGASQQSTVVDSFASSPDRRATLELSAAESMLAEMSEALADGAEPGASTEAAARRRRSIASHNTAAAASSSNTGVRRSTLDPRDVSLMQSKPAEGAKERVQVEAEAESLRRQTIGDSELDELNSVLGSVSMGEQAPRPGSSPVDGARKRANAFDAASDQPSKRAKASSPSRPKKSEEAGEKQRSPAGSKSPSPASIPSRIPRPRSSKAPLPSRSSEAAPPAADLLSPPAQGSRSKAPLRGILSARKRAKDQPTPTKSVNFGPPQGIEFNHGSPSTSMTPMNAHKAKKMFPLERPSSPDDDETSLNSSILDEANARSPDLDFGKKGEDDTLDGEDDRRSSLAVLKSTSKVRRRYSLRGVSPLDNQREARRRRRASTASTGASLLSSQPPTTFLAPTPKQSSFLADASMSLQDPTPYADSSASSDAGEDMELTGEHSFQASAVLQESINIMTSSIHGRSAKAADADANADEDDNTVELGSLGDLLAESAAYELPSAAAVVAAAAAAASRISASQDHEVTLDPIQEEDESGANSSRQSMMSLASTADDSDADEAGERRTSLAVNLSSQFERIGSATKASEDKAADEEDTVFIPPIALDELLSSVELDKTQTAVKSGPGFFETDFGTAGADLTSLCSVEACADVIEWHAKEITSWSTGLSDVLPALLRETAPAFLGDERIVGDVKQAVKELYAGVAANVRSGWCQWRARMEVQMAEKLTDCSNDLETDASSLKATVATDALQRQSEVAAIQELIERETQMAQLLDAIEEQQAVRNEFAASVATLENQCSSLALEESVLQTQLRVLEGRAHELEPVTTSKSIRAQHELLEAEEVFSIQESLSGWRVLDATAAHVKVTARHQDVLFDVDVDVSVAVQAPEDDADDAPFTATIKAREAIKRRKQSVYLKPDRDVVLLVQRQLFDPARLAVVVGEARGRAGAQSRHARLCANVQLLQSYVAQAFQFLRELRALSTHLSLSLDVAERVLWTQFVQFPPPSSGPDAIGCKFRVGLPFGHVAPFASGEAVVDVAYGSISADAVRQEVARVPRDRVEYLSRVCRRLHDVFVRR